MAGEIMPNNAPPAKASPWRWLISPWRLVREGLQLAVAFLSGYDVFVSYAWDDGTTYPSHLAQRLRELHYKVFLDKEVYQAGDDLRAATRLRVGMSSVLAVVLRPEALKSKWVIDEVAACDGAGKTLIVIDVNGTFATMSKEHPLYSRFESTLRIEDSQLSNDGPPAEETIDRISGRFTFVSAETRFARSVAGALTVGLMLVLVGGYLFLAKRSETRLRLAARLEADGNRSIQLADEGSPEQGIATALAGFADFAREGGDHLPDSLSVGLSKAVDGATQMVAVHEHVKSAAIWRDGKSFLVVDMKGAMNIYRDDAQRTNKVIASYGLVPGFFHIPVRLNQAQLFSDGSDAILAWGRDNLLRVFDAPGYWRAKTYGNSDVGSEWSDATNQIGQSYGGFSTDGSHVWSLSQDGTFRYFDRVTAKCCWDYGPSPRVHAASLSPDGRFLVLLTGTNLVQLFQNTNNSSYSPFGLSISFTNWPRFSFSPDSKWLLMNYSDGAFELRCLRDGPSHTQRLFQLQSESAFAPDSSFFVLIAASRLGGADGKIVDTAGGNELESFHLPYQVLKVQNLPKDAGMIVAGNDNQVHLLSMTGTELRRYGARFNRMPDLHLSDDASRLLATDMDGEAVLHATFGQGFLRAELATNSFSTFWFDNTGKRILALYTNGDLDLLDSASLKLSWHLTNVQSASSGLRLPGLAQYSAQTGELLYFNFQELLRISTTNGEVLARRQFTAQPVGVLGFGFCGRSQERAFLCLAQQSDVYLLDRDLTTLQTIRGMTNDRTQIVFYSPGQNALIIAGTNGTVRICDSIGGAERQQYPLFTNRLESYSAAPGGVLTSHSVTPSGTRVLFTGDSGQFEVINLNSHAIVRPNLNDAQKLARYTWSGAFLSPDESVFVLTHFLGFAELRNASDGTLISELAVPKQFVSFLAFSPDSRYVFISDNQGLIRQFDARTGSLHRVYNGHTAGSVGFVISPDSTRLLSFGSDGRLVLWGAQDEDLIGKALDILDNQAAHGGADAQTLAESRIVRDDLNSRSSRLKRAFAARE